MSVTSARSHSPITVIVHEPDEPPSICFETVKQEIEERYKLGNLPLYDYGPQFIYPIRTHEIEFGKDSLGYYYISVDIQYKLTPSEAPIHEDVITFRFNKMGLQDFLARERLEELIKELPITAYKMEEWTLKLFQGLFDIDFPDCTDDVDLSNLVWIHLPTQER